MKFQRLIILAILLSVFSCFVSTHSAQATTVASLSDSQLVSYSDYIVHATILRIDPIQFDENTIITRVTVKVHRYLKVPAGDVQPEQFEFYTRGGVVGDVHQMVPGEYEPEVGTEGMFFLERIRRFQGLPFVLGLTQGVFAADSLSVTRVDRKISKGVHRDRTFIRTESDFDRASDFYELLDVVEQAVTRGAVNHE